MFSAKVILPWQRMPEQTMMRGYSGGKAGQKKGDSVMSTLEISPGFDTDREQGDV